MNDPTDKLEAMPPSELAEELEAALDAMTEETYDPAMIEAYLDALDRKSPMPAHPSAEASYQEFYAKLQGYAEQSVSKPAKKRRKSWKIARVGLVAALLLTLLAGAAQAAGIDMAAGFARWTESLFSFGEIQSDTPSSHNPSIRYQDPADLPEEYQELVAEFENQGIEAYTIPGYIPDGFQIETSVQTKRTPGNP